MSRNNKRPISKEECKIILELPEAVVRCVRDLVEIGIFGASPASVVERLVCDRIMDLAQDDWLNVKGFPSRD